MLAIKRKYLAPFVTIGAILITALPAAGIATAMAGPAAPATHSTHLAAILRSCPAGTNWDNIKNICV